MGTEIVSVITRICRSGEGTDCKGHAAAAAKSLQSCLTLCDPVDGSPPGFSIPVILPARILEWAAISFSTRGIREPFKVMECFIS